MDREWAIRHYHSYFGRKGFDTHNQALMPENLKLEDWIKSMSEVKPLVYEPNPFLKLIREIPKTEEIEE